MKVAVYARESSDDTKRAPSITDQISRIQQYITKEGHELVKVYQDNGYSGGDWNRPDWNQIVKDGRARKFTMVIVWDQDRLARDTEQFLWFYRNLRERNKEMVIYSLTEGVIDMETLGGRVKHTSMAQAAEIFRLVTSEKVKGVYRSKVEEAKKNGTRIMWGRAKYIPDEIIEKILRIHEENPTFGTRRIASMLPTYKGKPKLMDDGTIKEGKTRKISHGFVGSVLKSVKNTPPKIGEGLQPETNKLEKQKETRTS